MQVEHFNYQYNKLSKEIEELYSLKNKVYNHHCYPISIDGIKLEISDEVRDLIMKQFDVKIASLKQEQEDLTQEFKSS